ncbi:MAG TPA: site-specific integrase [Syntrophobacter fumaroxidans]|nr:site-specific integrase [Syntrophobacter fumaroxidans]
MSVYLVKGKGWRYEFELDGARYTHSFYRTKREAKNASTKRREELKNPKPVMEIQTDMDFLDLVNERLDYVKARHVQGHYDHCRYMARKWVERWGEMKCSQITQKMIEEFLQERKDAHSGGTANRELRYLRATFNHGGKRIKENPTDGIKFFAESRKAKYTPSSDDLDKIIAIADPDTQDYLWSIRDTLGRMTEINRLTWPDVDFINRCVSLYTRKRENGNLESRLVPMTEKLFEIFSRRFETRDQSIPWVFWHTYTSSKTCEKTTGPYIDRKKFMKTLCKKAGVPYFRFHRIRHSGASIMDDCKVATVTIQKMLGHKKRETTEIYLHPIKGSDRAAVAVFERARTIKPHTEPHTNKEGVTVN